MKRPTIALALLGSLCMGYAGPVTTLAAPAMPHQPAGDGRRPRAGQQVDARRSAIPAAWTYVRSRLPRAVAVLRPGWLPVRFRAAPLVIGVHVERLSDASHHTGYTVGYRSVNGDVAQFALGAVNAGPPDTATPIRVRGVQGTLVTSSLWPPVGVYWREHGQFYAIQAHGVTHAEMLHIVAGLAPVPPAP